MMIGICMYFTIFVYLEYKKNQINLKVRNHQGSSERNLTPLQILVLCADNFPPLEEIDDNNYGVDGNVNVDEDDREEYLLSFT